MSIMNRLSHAVERATLAAARTRARRYLLDRSDRFLADAGLSRELLERGNGAWPWRVETPAAAIPVPDARRPLGTDARRELAVLGTGRRPTVEPVALAPTGTPAPANRKAA